MRRTDDTQHICCRRLLLPRLGEVASPLVELLLKVGCGGIATTCSSWSTEALELRSIAAAGFHSHAACRCTGLSGDAAAAPQHRLMKWRRPMANIGFL
jgi:hypothetical protein